MRVGLGLLTGIAACGRIGFDPLDGGGADVPPAASCADLPRTCGSSGDRSCCESPIVPGGDYYRSYDVGADGMYSVMDAPATVSTFRLDRYEITVGRFRAFVDAGFGTKANPPSGGAGGHPMLPASGWDSTWNGSLPADAGSLVAQLDCLPAMPIYTWTDGNEQRPINCLSWYEAMAFCIWDGGYLPTEAEWNYAASGGSEHRAYPWSNPPSSLALDDAHASYGIGSDCRGDGMAGCAVTDLVPVGTKPAGDGRWGHADLAGNVSEWTLDYFALYTTPCVDCANLTPDPDRVYRGGSFYPDPFYPIRGAVRHNDVPAPPYITVGARCARSP